MDTTANNEARILRLPEVKRLTGLSRSTIYNYVRAGQFPRHISLGARSVGWRSTDIETWISSRLPVQPA